MILVEGRKVGRAYKRAILGAQTGRVYKVQRTPERELLPMAEGFELAVMGWSPMAAGILTGKYKTTSAPLKWY
jgi:aryl-alcohol dehydrogenase-like predicted oxidoreductase